MLHILNYFGEVKNTTGIFLIQNKFDTEQLDFLSLDEKIVSKIQKIVDAQENSIFSLYLGREDLEEIVCFFHLDKTKDIQVFLGENIQKIPQNIAFEYKKDNILLDSIILGKYEYTQYKKPKKELEISIITQEEHTSFLEQRIGTLTNITHTRDLVNMPSQDKTPEKYFQYIKKIKWKNTRVKTLDFEELKREGLGLLEAVGRASHSKPRLVILEHIVDKKLPTLGFVGKGVTFDTGGLNIKLDDNMFDMKMDMAGSATLLYMMKEIDEKKLNCNVVCALAIAENSISGDAYRPGDILTSYSGKTVEITNTDAEGRLVLADGISYISKNYALESITSVATLTGACMVALGYHYAGIMGNNRHIIDKLLGNPTFEKYWELPLNTYLEGKTSGKISDLINYTSGVMTGASMGGAFLKQFLLNKEKFTHIDIAGPAMMKEKYGIYNVGATGFGVESLSQMILNYENNGNM